MKEKKKSMVKLLLAKLKKDVKHLQKKTKLNFSFFQSNVEGVIVEEIQKIRNTHNGIIINAGGYTHTSVAIHDALKILKIPIIELHITNIYNREDFRHKSLISKLAVGVLCGFGSDGYIMALDAMKKNLENEKIDKKLIKELVDHLSEFNLTELEYQEGQTRIKVSKGSKIVDQIKTGAVVSPNKAVLNNSDEIDGIRIKSPIIGTAYLAPEPGAKKFVEVGDKIKKGQTIMIVEAMKTMNRMFLLQVTVL